MPEHNKIINQVAKTFFGPLNIQRKGKSRLWFEDNGWFLTIIEFQPSSYSRGTYLNLGVSFNNYPNGHFSYDLGGRMEGFVEAENISDFESELTNLIEKSIPLVNKYRMGLDRTKSPGSFIRGQLDIQSLKDTGWSNYHIGFAYLIENEVELAKEHLRQVVASDDQRAWAKERAKYAQNLIELKFDPTRLSKIINRSRVLKKLEPLKDHSLFSY